MLVTGQIMGVTEYATKTHLTMFVIDREEEPEQEETVQTQTPDVVSVIEIEEKEEEFVFDFFSKWRPAKREVVKDREYVPLTAFVYDITPNGNLTIRFNKPIIVPKMVIHNNNRTIGFGLR